MKLTVNDLYTIKSELVSLYQTNMPFALSYKVARFIKAVDGEYDTAETSRTNIILRYCLRDDDNNPIVSDNGDITICPEYVDSYKKEMDDLINTEIDVNVEKLPNNVTEYVNIRPSSIESFMKIIEE